MLIEYGVLNYFSFKEGGTVSFRFDGNTPEGISQGREYSTVMGVNGANSAGKTHLLKGLAFLNWFCANSFSWEVDAEMPLAAYGDSKEPSELYAEFLCGNVKYRFECSLTDKAVVREALYRTKSREVVLYERINNEIIYAHKSFLGLKSLKYRQNASVISTVNQHKIGLLEDVFGFFDSIFANVGYGGFYELHRDINRTAKALNEAPSLLRMVEKFISECDTGVSRIRILDRENEKGEKTFFPMFVHVIGDDEYAVTPYTESSGTKRLFQILPFFFSALETGGILVMDEFDLHLHPHLLPKMLGLFLDPKTNRSNAQLIFTSHDTKIMNHLGRYRSVVAVKRDNESFVVRLDEIPGDVLRNDRPIDTVYDDGRIGGVPRL